MVFSCVLCKAKFVRPTERSFHRLPVQDDELRKKWVDFIRTNLGNDNWQPNNMQRLCSHHFNMDDYKNYPGCHRLLKSGAYPSNFQLTSEELARRLAASNRPTEYLAVRNLMTITTRKSSNASEKASNVDAPPPKTSCATESQEEADAPPPKKSCLTASQEEVDGSSSQPTEQVICRTEKPVVPKNMEVTVLNIYETHIKRLAEIEALPQPLMEREVGELKKLKIIKAKLEDLLIKHGARSIRDNLVITEEMKGQATEFVQAEYLLLKFGQKLHESAIAKKNKVIEDLEEQKKMLLEIVDDLRDDLGNSCNRLEELEKERDNLLTKTQTTRAFEQEVQKQKEDLLKIRAENARLRLLLITQRNMFVNRR